MTVTAATAPRQQALIGIGCMMLGVSLAAAGDAVAKYLGQTLPVPQLVWGRYIFSTAVILPIVLSRVSLATIVASASWIELTRGLSMLAITVAYFTAVQFLPLADALGLLLLYPLISAAMAAVWLGERVGLATMLIMSTAFGGALLVVKPGFATVNIGVFCALGAAVAVALNIVINRHLAGRTPTIVGLFYSSVIGLVISTVLIPFDWTLPDPGQWLLLAVLGLVMAAATYFVYLAFSFAPTATVAPFGYSEVITATVLGYVLFADFPDGASLAGIAVITACGMWIALRGPR